MGEKETAGDEGRRNRKSFSFLASGRAEGGRSGKGEKITHTACHGAKKRGERDRGTLVDRLERGGKKPLLIQLQRKRCGEEGGESVVDTGKRGEGGGRKKRGRAEVELRRKEKKGREEIFFSSSLSCLSFSRDLILPQGKEAGRP